MKDEEGAKTITQIRDAAARVFSAEPIVAAYLYGSYARRENFPSDIDIAIYLEPGTHLSLEKELRMAGRLEEESRLRPIDLRVINDMPLTFQGEVITRGILVYSSDESARVSFETRVYDLFFDYLPHLKKLRREFLRNVAEKGVS